MNDINRFETLSKLISLRDQKDRLSQLSHEEWESLCKQCGRCCLAKFIDLEDKEIMYTNVACKFLDLKTGKCTEYERRNEVFPDCQKVSLDNEKMIRVLPASCIYRSLITGRKMFQPTDKIGNFAISEEESIRHPEKVRQLDSESV